jgi:AcrR family transcriptional regulator
VTGSRRTIIVSAAAELFATDGYPSTGMDRIGAAAGISGPAIYRHFSSKSAVLAAVFDGILDAVTARPVPVVDDGDPAAALRAVIEVYAGAVATRRRLMAVFVREVHHLPSGQRSGLDERQRQLVREWRTLLSAVHPQWSAEVVRICVHGCFGLLNSVGTFDAGINDDELTRVLTGLAARILDLPGS